MPRKTQQASRARKTKSRDTTSYQQSMGDAAPKVKTRPRYPRMPHERDESAAATGDRLKENPVPSDRQISQAQSDVEHGLVDTDRRGIPNDLPKPKRSK